MRRAVAVLLAASSAGCFTVSTTDVLLRDAGRVTLADAETGAPALPAASARATIARGEYWYGFSREPYEIVAEREQGGTLALRCDACAAADWPLSGTDRVALVGDDRRTLPASSWDVAIAGGTVTAAYDVCMLRSRHACSVDARTRLVAPIDDVVEVRRRIEPVRFWGWMLLAAGVIGLGMASYVTFAPGSPAGSSIGERAPWGAAFFAPSAIWTSIGLWELLTPAREQIWRPEAPPR